MEMEIPSIVEVISERRIRKILAHADDMRQDLVIANTKNAALEARIMTVQHVIRLATLFSDTIAHLPGVYILYDSYAEVRYIGQSSDVAERIGRHTDKPYSFARMLRVEDYADRIALERDLVGILCPPLNVQGNPALGEALLKTKRMSGNSGQTATDSGQAPDFDPGDFI